jgi:hypothetical protein
MAKGLLLGFQPKADEPLAQRRSFASQKPKNKNLLSQECVGVINSEGRKFGDLHGRYLEAR